ncbi:MAG TPA: DUF4255 domain-containing protein [Candidatus Angelobacter sp.]
MLIETTLGLIRQKLNDFFSKIDPAVEDWVVLSNIVDHEGRLYEETKDKIVMFLANIQHETVVSTYNRAVPIKDNKYAAVAPPLYIDLFVVFFANFYGRNYAQGLGMISRTISFFQQNSWFTHENLPDLDDVIDKLTFEITNLDMVDLSYLMGMLGTQYLPSVFYKVRMLPFAGDAMQAEIPAARGMQDPGWPMESNAPRPRHTPEPEEDE